jgi:hypothetical protein
LWPASNAGGIAYKRSVSARDVDQIVAQVRTAAGAGATVEPFGSSVYAPAHASDVDLLVTGADPGALATALGLELLPTTPPRLAGTLADRSVDVIVVAASDERAKTAPRDAARIVEHLGARHDVFLAAWPDVRRFVHARALGHNGLGWFGSFGWALLLAIPLVHDPELSRAPIGGVIPGWLRWCAKLQLGARLGLDGVRGGDPAPFYLAAPSPPTREVTRLSRQAATTLLAELVAAARTAGEAATDAAAIDLIADLADAPPRGMTLAITGADPRVRGRYDGLARGLLRELEPLGGIRSWGRFEPADDGWEHRITVPAHRVAGARTMIDAWLARSYLDASVTLVAT